MSVSTPASHERIFCLHSLLARLHIYMWAPRDLCMLRTCAFACALSSVLPHLGRLVLLGLSPIQWPLGSSTLALAHALSALALCCLLLWLER